MNAPLLPFSAVKPEHEISDFVDMCLPSGRLNPAAVGWSRRGLHRDNLRGWGRNKRFDYWCIMAGDFVVTANISHHDYRANVASTFIDLRTQDVVSYRVNRWLPPRQTMPDPTSRAPMVAQADGIEVAIVPEQGGTRLRTCTARLQLEAFVEEPEGHESMGVLVPWSDRTFQYTRKDNCLRASGSVTVDGRLRIIEPARALALHDVGRGRWPYSTWWNWAAGQGVTGGRMVGLQLGGKWTVGTPSTENCLRIDGRIHKISEELSWAYDSADFTRPWTIRGARVDLTFTPGTHHHHNFNKWVISARGDQCFGCFDGTVVSDVGEVVAIENLPGMAEEVHRRW